LSDGSAVPSPAPNGRLRPATLKCDFAGLTVIDWRLWWSGRGDWVTGVRLLRMRRTHHSSTSPASSIFHALRRTVCVIYSVIKATIRMVGWWGKGGVRRNAGYPVGWGLEYWRTVATFDWVELCGWIKL